MEQYTAHALAAGRDFDQALSIALEVMKELEKETVRMPEDSREKIQNLVGDMIEGGSQPPGIVHSAKGVCELLHRAAETKNLHEETLWTLASGYLRSGREWSFLGQSIIIVVQEVEAAMSSLPPAERDLLRSIGAEYLSSGRAPEATAVRAHQVVREFRNASVDLPREQKDIVAEFAAAYVRGGRDAAFAIERAVRMAQNFIDQSQELDEDDARLAKELVAEYLS